MKFKAQDVEDCVKANYHNRFEEGWEVFKVYTEHFYAVKIRKTYDKDESAFNEDGYKYDMLYVDVNKTKDYLFFLDRGYDAQSLKKRLV